MPRDEERQISVRVSEALHRELKHAAADRGLTLEQIAQQALVAWLAMHSWSTPASGSSH